MADDAQCMPVLGIEPDFDVDHAAGIEQRVAGRGTWFFQLSGERGRGQQAAQNINGDGPRGGQAWNGSGQFRRQGL